MSSLIEAFFALKIGNNGLAREKILSILRKEPEKIIFDNSFIHYLPDEKKEEIISSIYKIVDLIATLLTDEKLKKVFLNYFSFFDSSSIVKALLEKHNAALSLVEVREMAESRYLGKELPALWFHMLLKKAFEMEAIQYLEKNMVSYIEDPHLEDNLWIFNYIMPRDDQGREKLISRLKSIDVKKNLWNQYSILKLYENEVYKRSLGETKPLFTLKRELYINMISEGIAPVYASFGLFQLGDNRIENIFHLQ